MGLLSSSEHLFLFQSKGGKKSEPLSRCFANWNLSSFVISVCANNLLMDAMGKLKAFFLV